MCQGTAPLVIFRRHILFSSHGSSFSVVKFLKMFVINPRPGEAETVEGQNLSEVTFSIILDTSLFVQYAFGCEKKFPREVGSEWQSRPRWLLVCTSCYLSKHQVSNPGLYSSPALLTSPNSRALSTYLLVVS